MNKKRGFEANRPLLVKDLMKYFSQTQEMKHFKRYYINFGRQSIFLLSFGGTEEECARDDLQK